MIIKPQQDATFERVTLRIPSDVWQEIGRYATLLGAATTPQYVCIEAIKAAIASPDYRRLAAQHNDQPAVEDSAAQDPPEPASAPRRPRRPAHEPTDVAAA